MPEPRCDWTCLSKKCDTPEGAPIFEATVKAKCCPECGSKRIRRIWTPPHIGRGVAKGVDGMLEHSGLREQLEARDRSRAVEQKEAHERPRPGDAVVAGFAGNMGALVSKATAPWATGPNGHNPFAGASAGPKKSATLGEGVVLGQKLPRGGTNVDVPGVGRMKLAGGARPTADSLSDGKGRPNV